jgi:hypothetical protein
LKYIFEILFKKYLFISLCLLLACGGAAIAQSTLPTAGNTTSSANNNKDTSKTNTNKWKDEEPSISYQKLNSAKVYSIDSGLHSFQRQAFLGAWGRDLGNLGSPVNNLFFTPEDRLGPTLGYHVYDPYRYNPDSLKFYTTNRPYSSFAYELGSKLEQTASIMHTQNVRPNWNVSVQYRKISSPGFYQIQRSNHDNAWLSTNYRSLDKHYTLSAGMVYNKEQHDENGGIAVPAELNDPVYNDRRTVDVAYENSEYSITRSPVYNNLRDFSFLLQHSYAWGETDTAYNADSTAFSYKLVPRFSITHKMELSTEKHIYNDLTPDSSRYTTLFSHSFANNGSGYYTQGQDSLFIQQNWFWIDNKIMLNGFFGSAGRQLEFSAGLGNRYDEFSTQPVDTAHSPGINRNNILSNYAEGEVKKEALHPGEWGYGADLKFFLTGQDAGNFLLNASLGKELKHGWGNFVAGFQQEINSAPYNYISYQNTDTQIFYTFKPESISKLYASIDNPRLRLSGGVNNYVIGNYIYVNQNEAPAQYSIPFTISQAWVRKVFKLGSFYLDNELAYQQLPLSAPVNVPALMGRHQLSYEKAAFKNRLKLNAGVEIRYNTPYRPAGYDALLNRFYYQNTSPVISNAPEASVFINFRIKRFRAFIMAENLQTLLFQNAILFTGTPVYNLNGTGVSAPYTIYAAPDALIRFGFVWPLVN